MTYQQQMKDDLKPILAKIKASLNDNATLTAFVEEMAYLASESYNAGYKAGVFKATKQIAKQRSKKVGTAFNASTAKSK